MKSSENATVQIIKKNGKKAIFNPEKLRQSLQRSGADERLIFEVIKVIEERLYDGISTTEIYSKAFELLKKQKPLFASKYKLKQAIYELGPTGFPFENFVGAILKYSGYKVEVGVFIDGKCVQHEVDVVAHKNKQFIIAECKFHNDDGRKSDVKVPLYIHSRFRDIRDKHKDNIPKGTLPNEGWVVTNTRFTTDAIDYANCAGIKLLSWDYPKYEGLKDIIDRLQLYPLTVSNLLSNAEKQQLLESDMVLCREILQNVAVLDTLKISEKRKENIIIELQQITQN